MKSTYLHRSYFSQICCFSENSKRSIPNCTIEKKTVETLFYFQIANVLWTHHLTTIVGIIAETVVAEISSLAPYVIFVLL